MKHLPELSDNGTFIILIVAGVTTIILFIGDVTGVTDAFINSF